ncbi:MAG TPA: D-erythronate dehydrogenase [Cyclobacteriaceae bacterium]|nr:D-erythronate dehydrogenase [Cyclobacteriaceae bacterium]
MQIIITGGGGFLGQRLAKALLQSNTISFDELILADINLPLNPMRDSRVRCVQVDLSETEAAKSLITTQTEIVFHLAAIVSSQAEKDFDLGWRINLDVTRQLLEACRHANKSIRFIFASSLAVYGGELPAVVNDETLITPRSSYGTQKAIGELLVNDYSRKGFIDGRALRLPTICVRPGKPNQAASSFVSSIIREPLNGETAVCPVSPDLSLFLSSPDTVVSNIVHAAGIHAGKLGDWRTLNLPGITVTVREMLDSLRRLTDDVTLARVTFQPDEAISRIVNSWPGIIDNSTALDLGFKVDAQFNDFILQYMGENNSGPDAP